jgi:hypothetical protein
MNQSSKRLTLLAVVAFVLAAVGGSALGAEIDAQVFGRVVGFHW